MKRLAVIASVLAPFGCATTNPAGAREDVSELLGDRLGIAESITIEQDEDSVDRVRARLDELLSEPLTGAAALELALLNNPELAAEMESLGVAQADLVDAGLLENPTVGADVIVSTLGFGLGGGFALGQNLLSAFLIPAQKKIARANLEAAVMSVGHRALTLARDVQAAYAEAVTAEATLRLHRQMLQLAQTHDEMAQALLDAGNVPFNERAEVGAHLDAARLEFAEVELERVHARERLTRLLGLWGEDVAWSVPDALPAPESLPVLEDLETLAIRSRLDVSAARAGVDAMKAAIKLRRAGIIPAIEVGVEGGNEVGDDIGHEWVIGPALSIEVPIFNPGHADFARLKAQLRGAEHHLRAVSVDARSETREYRAELVTALRRATYYGDTMVPRQDALAQHMLERYNAMLIGAGELFEVRHERLEVLVGQLEARRDYWTARAELELTVGGRLGG